MHRLSAVCVFCGSNPGADPAYAESARRMGQTLADRGVTLVYGGGRVGLMGALADAALEAGGRVIGVIPEALRRREVAHERLTQLRVVQTMHERKQLMADLSDGFIAMPGGFGTFEEFCEVLTWSQLGMHAKPCGLLNVKSYYAGLLALFDHAVAEQLLHPRNRAMVIADSEPKPLLEAMIRYRAPAVEKWLTAETT
ncbi:MAG TPA: TIGR00730 family Rossman fold protein [Burkholderiales bacterium]|nr:TIGR00730 family Rossman fold protein [Burkholderiales bacterium]